MVLLLFDALSPRNIDVRNIFIDFVQIDKFEGGGSLESAFWILCVIGKTAVLAVFCPTIMYRINGWITDRQNFIWIAEKISYICK